SLGTGRATGDVDVHGDHFVHTVHDVVLPVVRAAVDRAAAHGDDVPGLRHLVIEDADPVGDLFVDGPGHDHQVGLAGTGTKDHAEAVKVVAGGAGGHHLNGAARDAKEQVPEGGLPAP